MSKQIITKVKGVNDIIPPESFLWEELETKARKLFKLYNYHEIRTPTFEYSHLFLRSIGENTDIVSKEIYSFKDRSEKILALRPEGTASVVRSFLENKLYNKKKINKLFYIGSMFRAERPQAGRFREFHQIGAEAFGSSDPLLDLELILMIFDIFKLFSLNENLTMIINSLGCKICRPAYRDDLVIYLEKVEDKLCDDCKKRIRRAPLRVLDCKLESCKKALIDPPLIDRYRCKECNSNFDFILGELENFNMNFKVDPKLARGLDYYTRTAFEIVSENLGAQNSLAGGGRYDDLTEELGSVKIDAIGFAVGIERIISLIKQRKEADFIKPDFVIIPLLDSAKSMAIKLASLIRSENFKTDLIFNNGNSIKSLMRNADKTNALFAIILGEDEINQNRLSLKNMKTGDQSTFDTESFFNKIKTIIKDF